MKAAEVQYGDWIRCRSERYSSVLGHFGEVIDISEPEKYIGVNFGAINNTKIGTLPLFAVDYNYIDLYRSSPLTWDNIRSGELVVCVRNNPTYYRQVGRVDRVVTDPASGKPTGYTVANLTDLRLIGQGEAVWRMINSFDKLLRVGCPTQAATKSVDSITLTLTVQGTKPCPLMYYGVGDCTCGKCAQRIAASRARVRLF